MKLNILTIKFSATYVKYIKDIQQRNLDANLCTASGVDTIKTVKKCS